MILNQGYLLLIEQLVYLPLAALDERLDALVGIITQLKGKERTKLLVPQEGNSLI